MQRSSAAALLNLNHCSDTYLLQPCPHPYQVSIHPDIHCQEHKVRGVLLTGNPPRKTADPDKAPGKVLRVCVLANCPTPNLPQSHHQPALILPHCPVALTSVILKCFKLRNWFSRTSRLCVPATDSRTRQRAPQKTTSPLLCTLCFSKDNLNLMRTYATLPAAKINTL